MIVTHEEPLMGIADVAYRGTGQGWDKWGEAE